MDTEAEFAAVRKDISEGRLSEVPLKIRSIAESSDEPFTIQDYDDIVAALRAAWDKMPSEQ